MGRPIAPALLVLTPIAAVAALLLHSFSGSTFAPGDPVAWAQVSSCGNALLEPGEDCDPPGSLSCPPGSPTGSFPCSSTCTCPPVTPVLDHFQCYATKRRKFPNQGVTVVDQFGTLEETVRRPEQLCVPTDKDGEGITDETDHLTNHALRRIDFTKRLNQTVVDQFGTLVLDVSRPSGLLVPTGKDGVTQQPPLDHFQCYHVKRSRGGPKFVKQTVSISNQIETTTVTLLEPHRLCAPADKNDEDPSAPSHPNHLLCYRTSGGRFGEETHSITSQFGTRDVLLIQRQDLCVPALKNPGPSTTSTTAVTTSSSTSSTTSSSTTSSTVASTSTSSTTTSSTTTTTVYGSPSRAFLSASRSLLD